MNNKKIIIIIILLAVVTGSIICISTRTTRQPVKRELGYNGQINFNTVSYDDTNFVNTIDSTGAEIIRYPGGTVANSFNWRIGQPSLTQLKALVQKRKCKVSFVLNMITSTLDEQMEMLDSAHILGIFKDSAFIEFGNEFNTPASEAMVKYGSPEAISQEIARWRKKINNKYPRVLFGCSGGDNQGKAVRDWNDKMLAQNPNIYLVWHYHNPRYYVFNGYVDTALVSYLIDSCYAAEFPNIKMRKIWITEYNLRNENSDEDVIFADEYQRGLAAAFMMQKFDRMGARLILFHNIVRAEDNGAIVANNRTSYLTSTGIMTANYIKNRTLLDTIETPPPPPIIFGLTPSYAADEYKVSMTRVSWFVEKPVNIVRKWIFLNVVHQNGFFSKGYQHWIDSTRAAFKYQMTAFGIENEQNYALNHPNSTIDEYFFNELKPTILFYGDTINSIIIDGGTTIELNFWYWNRTKDTSFFNNAIPEDAKQRLISGRLQGRIDTMQMYLDMVKTLPTMRYLNVHFYLWQPNQIESFNKMFRYVSDYVGKPLLSNECGIWADGLLNDVTQIARDNNFPFCILWRGDNTRQARYFTKEEYHNATQ